MYTYKNKRKTDLYHEINRLARTTIADEEKHYKHADIPAER